MTIKFLPIVKTFLSEQENLGGKFEEQAPLTTEETGLQNESLIMMIGLCLTFAATVKCLNFGKREIFAEIYLKFKQRGQTLRVCCKNGAME